MVFAVFMLGALSFGIMGSISAFLKPLSNEFDWSRASTSFLYTIASLGAAFFGVFWGFISDKYGTKLFGYIAAVFMAGILFLLSKQTGLFEFYLLYFLFGAFGTAIVGAPLYANVGFWFKKNPGLAIGLSAAGGAAGQGSIPYISSQLIDKSGWQTAYIYLALIYFVIMVPLSFLIKESPLRETARKLTSNLPKDFPLSDREVIIWISIAVIFCCNCMAVPIVHLIPLLTDVGFSPKFASQVFMVLMFFGIFGRIFSGKLGDTIGALPTYILMSVGQTVSVLWFPYFQSSISLYILAAIFGFTYSGVMSAILVCARMMVSPNFAGRAMSFGSFFGWMGMGLGGLLGGYFYDLRGDYIWSYQFASAMGVINVIILLLLWLRIKKQRTKKKIT